MTETEETVLDPLPCPFCGCARIYERGFRCFECPECRAEGPTKATKAEAVAAWNTRAALSRAPGAEDLGGSTRMTSPASRSQTPLSAGWQDISTAPKDGQDVLIWNAEGAEIARWYPLEEDGSDQPGHDEGWIGTFAFPGRSWGYRLRSEPQGQPSHWMPLPEPPAEEDLSGAQQSELTRLARDEPISSPPSTGGALTGGGFVYHNPDVGTEYAPSHPVESGEVPDATDIRASTQFEDWLVREAAVNRPTSPEMGEWRPEVRAFADLMEAQLRANDHKPGWKDDTDLDLFERLGQESAELLAALRRNAKRLMWGDSWVMEDTVPRVGAEAADVANFAMMIADVCGALKLKENGLSREGLGGSARASRGAAGPSDCAEIVAPRSGGWRVKDHADGWIVFATGAEALAEVAAMGGALIEPSPQNSDGGRV